MVTAHVVRDMETETIILNDGSEKEVTGERITEFDGNVFVWNTWPESIDEAFLNGDYDKYEGARLA